MIKVIYYGELTDVCNCQSEIVESSARTAKELIDELCQKHEGLAKINFSVSRANKIIELKDELNNEEIALLPAFSGG